VKSEEGQDEHDHDDKTDQIDDGIHLQGSLVRPTKRKDKGAVPLTPDARTVFSLRLKASALHHRVVG
jgi:hypothetical protein